MIGITVERQGSTQYYMAASKKKICLLFFTVYSFFICFLFNVFGWTLSYEQMTYEWKVLNMHQARRTVFNYALVHFGIFAFCCLFYFRKEASKRNKNSFIPLKGTQANFDEHFRSEEFS